MDLPVIELKRGYFHFILNLKGVSAYSSNIYVAKLCHVINSIILDNLLPITLNYNLPNLMLDGNLVRL